MPEPALRLSAVDAGYGERSVLRDVSLACAPGELLGVLGANGSGKTTLVRVAAGVLPPAAGEVRLDGEPIRELTSRQVARRVAVLAQESGPLFPLTALEAVLLGRHPWQPAFAFEGEEDVEQARVALREVEALHLEDRDLTRLSGGERQRVLLARALCQGGHVLLCDEPTAHLDLRHQVAVFGLLRRLADGGRAVVLVTHDTHLAAQACDRIALLRSTADGAPSVLADGTPSTVLTRENVREAYGVDVDVETDARGVPYVRRRLDLRKRAEPGAGEGR